MWCRLVFLVEIWDFQAHEEFLKLLKQSYMSRKAEKRDDRGVYGKSKRRGASDMVGRTKSGIPDSMSYHGDAHYNSKTNLDSAKPGQKCGRPERTESPANGREAAKTAKLWFYVVIAIGLHSTLRMGRRMEEQCD